MATITMNRKDFIKTFYNTKNYHAYKGIINAYKQKKIAIKKLFQQGVIMIVDGHCINAHQKMSGQFTLTSEKQKHLLMLKDKYL
tara:strand:+ start:585 stop:836 length:252 start_codon:yes stop_codon:yes gene_type:complete